MKGDGDCGWRGISFIFSARRTRLIPSVIYPAVAFGYFESLFTLRDAQRVQSELERIKSLTKLLDQVGQQEHMYEMFVDAVEMLLTEIGQAIQNGVLDESFLVDSFNDEYNSSTMITCFRVFLHVVFFFFFFFFYFLFFIFLKEAHCYFSSSQAGG